MTKMSHEKQDFLRQPYIGVPALKQSCQGPLTTPLWYDHDLGGDVSFIAADPRKHDHNHR